MAKLSPNKFRCDNCGGIFDKGDEEEALAEMKGNFGDLPADERAVICDDCYEKFMKWMSVQRN